ncbi:hypothetical protein P886_4903 [Alteromonadaceae bacterium 2753L.S.0a.02]|nr:hypothetical protein P886_4903 [Alteromonadaceae bacterium 2753L.S.0a.02]
MTEKTELVLKRKVVEGHLSHLLDSNDAVYAVLLSSIDGHAIANKAKGEFTDSKLAAMTSSCLALGEKIALEAKQNNCDFVIIQNEDGYLTLKRIGKKLVLSALANKSVNLGMLLSATRNTAESFQKEVGL